jgi:hypothetical protein
VFIAGARAHCDDGRCHERDPVAVPSGGGGDGLDVCGLARAGITTIAAANAWLEDHYKAEHNRQFAIAPEEEGTAVVPDREGTWRDILCVIEERVVGNDNTVAWNGRRLQLPESRLRPHFVRAKEQVRSYPNGEMAIDLGAHRLARHGADGREAPAASRVAACSKASRMACRRWSARLAHRSGHP